MNQSHPVLHPAESSASLQQGQLGQLGQGTSRWKFRVFVLHSLVSTDEQQQVFEEPAEDAVHVILASNIAESSLTLPRVRLVIDFCLRRQLVYDERRHLSSLVRVWSSKASSQQRLGRTGRVFAGLCVRMITRRFYETLQEHDPAEMLTAPLEKLYLQTKLLGYKLANSYTTKMFSKRAREILGMEPDEVLSFTALQLLQLSVEPPSGASITSAIEGLDAIGALSGSSEDAEITCLGHMAMHLPLDVRLSRLLYYGIAFGVPADTVILAACLSAQDPFTMPSHLVIPDPRSYSQAIQRSLKSRVDFDGGMYSEPLMLRNMVIEWLLEFAVRTSQAKLSTRRGGSINTRVELTRSCKAFAQAHSIVPKRLVYLATSTVEIASRLERLLDPDSCGTAIRDLRVLLRYLSPGSKEGREMSFAGSVFSKDMLFLKGVLAAAFSPQFALGKPGLALPPTATPGTLGTHTLPVTKKSRIIKLMIKEGVDPSRTIMVRKIPKPLCALPVLNAALRLMCPGIDTEPRLVTDGHVPCALVTFPATANNQMLEPSYMPNGLGRRAPRTVRSDVDIIRDWACLPIVAHVLNQFGGARWTFPVPLPRDLGILRPMSMVDVRGDMELRADEEEEEEETEPGDEEDERLPQRGSPPSHGTAANAFYGREDTLLDADMSDAHDDRSSTARARLVRAAPVMDTDYRTFYEHALMIDQPTSPCLVKWELLGFWSTSELDALRTAGPRRRRDATAALHIEGKCNYRNPLGFLAVFPRGFPAMAQKQTDTPVREEEGEGNCASLVSVFVTQQGTNVPSKSWIEGATILPSDVAPKLILGFTRHTFAMQYDVKAHVVHGVSISGLKLVGSQQTLPITITQDGKVPTAAAPGTMALSLEDLGDVNQLRERFSRFIDESEARTRAATGSRGTAAPRQRRAGYETDPCVFVDRDVELIGALHRILRPSSVQPSPMMPQRVDEATFSAFGPLSPAAFDGRAAAILDRARGMSEKKLTELLTLEVFQPSPTETPRFLEPIRLDAIAQFVAQLRHQWMVKVQPPPPKPIQGGRGKRKSARKTQADNRAAAKQKPGEPSPPGASASNWWPHYPNVAPRMRNPVYGDFRRGSSASPFRENVPSAQQHAPVSQPPPMYGMWGPPPPLYGSQSHNRMTGILAPRPGPLAPPYYGEMAYQVPQFIPPSTSPSPLQGFGFPHYDRRHDFVPDGNNQDDH